MDDDRRDSPSEMLHKFLHEVFKGQDFTNTTTVEVRALSPTVNQKPYYVWLGKW
jgi:hypothetical protein